MYFCFSNLSRPTSIKMYLVSVSCQGNILLFQLYFKTNNSYLQKNPSFSQCFNPLTSIVTVRLTFYRGQIPVIKTRQTPFLAVCSSSSHWIECVMAVISTGWQVAIKYLLLRRAESEPKVYCRYLSSNNYCQWR